MLQRVKDFLFRRLVTVGRAKEDLSLYYDLKTIDENIAIYEGNPSWRSSKLESLKLGSAVVSEIARKATIEFESNVTGGSLADYVDAQYQRLVDRTRDITERLLVQGNLILKPYVDDVTGRIAVEVVNSKNFVPLKFNSLGDMTSVAFLEVVKINNKYYTRYEEHELDEYTSVYKITNRAYSGKGVSVSGKTGEEVRLSVNPDWEMLEREIVIEGVDRPLFVHMKTPYTNSDNIESPLGVSVFSKIKRQLMDYDHVHEDSMHDVHFKRAKIFAPSSYFQGPRDSNGRLLNGVTDGDMFVKLNVNVDESPGVDIDVFSPELRDESYSRVKNSILRQMEFNAGLAYGDLSDISHVDRTATELKANKERSWSTIVDIQKRIELAYREVVDVMSIYITLYTGRANEENLEISFHFDDSIVVDEEYDVKVLLEEVKLGLISVKEYLMRRYDVTESEALAMMPEEESKVEEDEDVSKQVDDTIDNNEDEDVKDEDNSENDKDLS